MVKLNTFARYLERSHDKESYTFSKTLNYILIYAHHQTDELIALRGEELLVSIAKLFPLIESE